MKNKLLVKRFFYTIAMVFLLMNVVAYFHAYKFTHFTGNTIYKTKSPEKLTLSGKVKALIVGVNNPRPANNVKPAQDFRIIKLHSNKTIECWGIERKNAKGTVIIFHGYSGNKSSMIANSDEFLKLGYNTLLVDFMGSGGSEGNQTTLGYNEAKDVYTVFKYLDKKGEKNIYLYGTSMGSVAIMKAIYDYRINPAGIIIECPFGSMYKTTCARFKIMNVPPFPMAALLVFWGGIQNGFWAFGHNPTEYAKYIKCPALLLYGEKDRNVSRQELDAIYTNLKGDKELKTFVYAGHESYLLHYKEDWRETIKKFLQKNTI